MLRLGTRGSSLARWQAAWVASRLRELGVEVELVPITTAGDRLQSASEASEGQGIFTKEIQRALLDGRIDLAVHSLKDLPTDTVEGLALAAVPERGPTGDALVCREKVSLDNLPLGTRIGTSSLRRRSQLLHARRDLVIVEIRGNVDSRLIKLDRGEVDALVLAEAGLRRLDLADRIAEVLPSDKLLPAVGQGALAIETRSDDRRARDLTGRLNHPPTWAAVLCERAMLATLQGGCLAPIAGLAITDSNQLSLTGRVLSRDGVQRIETTQRSASDDAVGVGTRVAESLLRQGAGELIASSRRLSE